MELKKREKVLERSYAKSNKVSKSDLKKSTPNKWLAASAVGVATLFYANPRSIFGSIGVVFGCIPAYRENLTSFGSTLNNISEMTVYSVVFFSMIALFIGFISIGRTSGLDKKSEEEQERLKRLSKSDRVMMWAFIIIALLLVVFHIAWEHWLSNYSFFYTGIN